MDPIDLETAISTLSEREKRVMLCIFLSCDRTAVDWEQVRRQSGLVNSWIIRKVYRRILTKIWHAIRPAVAPPVQPAKKPKRKAPKDNDQGDKICTLLNQVIVCDGDGSDDVLLPGDYELTETTVDTGTATDEINPVDFGSALSSSRDGTKNIIVPDWIILEHDTAAQENAKHLRDVACIEEFLAGSPGDFDDIMSENDFKEVDEESDVADEGEHGDMADI